MGADALPIRVPRYMAIGLLDGRWGCFLHHGDVPSISDRLEHRSSLGLSSLFPLSVVAACAPRGFSDESDEFGISETRRWLVDSGSGWDLVSSEHVSHLSDLIRKPQYAPRLWTANGVTTVNQEVPLYISELDEQCVPFVLKNTPDVLTFLLPTT